MVEMEQAHSLAYMCDVELHEMEQSTDEQGDGEWSYPCRCGDTFLFTEAMLQDGHDSMECRSCSLSIRIASTASAYAPPTPSPLNVPQILNENVTH